MPKTNTYTIGFKESPILFSRINNNVASELFEINSLIHDLQKKGEY